MAQVTPQGCGWQRVQMGPGCGRGGQTDTQQSWEGDRVVPGQPVVPGAKGAE